MAPRRFIHLFATVAVVAWATSAAADQIFSARIGRLTFPSGVNEPKLSIALWPPADSGNEPAEESGHESVVMSDAEGRRYKCVLPRRPLLSEAEQRQQEQKQKEKENREGGGGESGSSAFDTRKSPEEMLDIFRNLPSCFYRVEGWWTYEFCYKKHIRQFHIEQRSDGQHAVTMEFMLGVFDAKATREAHRTPRGSTSIPWGADGGKKRSHLHVFTNGTTCDLTDTSRRTEVRFICDDNEQQSYMQSIREGSTCEYEMIFATNILCKHPAFRTAQAPVHFINCHALHSGSPSDSDALEASGAELMFGRRIDELMREGEKREGKGEEEEQKVEEEEGVREEEQGGEDGEDDDEENFLEVDPEVEEIMEKLTTL